MGETDSLSGSDIKPDILRTQYYFLVAIVVLYYDYALTFSMEVQRFWTQRTFSWALFFFYLNRYLSLLGHLPVIVEYFASGISEAPNVCGHLQTYHQYFSIVAQLVVGVLLIMRVYALYNRSRPVLVFMCTVAACVVAFGCWVIMSGKKTPPMQRLTTDIGCVEPLTKTEANRFTAAWGALLLSDFILFCMTLAKALKVRRTRDRGLTNVLLRDGAVYFLVICLANLANILTLVLGNPIIRGIGTTFTNVISVVMMSRLMLNLRSPSLTRRRRQTTSRSSIEFRTGPTTDRPYLSTVVSGFRRDRDSNPDADKTTPSPIIDDVELVPRTVSHGQSSIDV